MMIKGLILSIILFINSCANIIPLSGGEKDIYPNLTGLVHGIDIRLMAPNTAGFNFGTLNNIVTSVIDWIIYQTDIDFGSYLIPDSRTFDAGNIIT